MKQTTQTHRIRKLSGFRLLIFLITLIFSSIVSKVDAQDLSSANISIAWYSEVGAFKCNVQAVEWDGYNEAFEYINFYVNGVYSIRLEASRDGNGNVGLQNTNTTVSDIYVTSAGWTTCPTANLYWLGDGYSNIEFWIYPTVGYIDTYCTISCEYKVNRQTLSDYQRNYYTQWEGSTPSVGYYPVFANDYINSVNGLFYFSVGVEGIGSYVQSSATVTIQESINNYDFYDISPSYTVSYYQHYVDNLYTIPYMVNGSYLSKQDYANGVWYRLKSVIDPDVGAGRYTKEAYSGGYHSGHTAVMKDALSLTQNSRNIILSWETLQPSGNPDTQNSADFGVEQYINGEWTEIATVAFNKDITNYSYTYTLSNSELEKGSVEYQFRARKKNYSDPIQISSYLLVSNSIVVDTDYKELIINEISPISSESSATVKWGFSKTTGIWDEQATVKLYVNGEEVNRTIDINYTNTEYTITGLSGCQTYSAYLTVGVDGLGSVLSTSEAKSFDQPSNERREITNLVVSKGYYNSYVTLSWEVPSDASDFNYFVINRKDINNGIETTLTQLTHTGLTTYNYQDNSLEAGRLYTYTVEGYSQCLDEPTRGASQSSYGFSQPYATVSGRIAYEGSQGVEGVTVSVVGVSSEGSNKALYFEGQSTSSQVVLPAKVYDFESNKAFTTQFWVKPSEQPANENFIISKSASFDISLVKSASGSSCTLYTYLLTQGVAHPEVVIAADKWSHITVTIQLNDSKSFADLSIYVDGEFIKTTSFSVPGETVIAPSIDELTILGGNSYGNSGFKGCLDELRVWNTALSADAIAKNYDTYLTGKESYLTSYYRCDESGSTQLFDLSGQNGSFNMNDGSIGNMVNHTTDTPSTEQLSIKGYTDINGNYIINTIPYTSDGIQYSIIPSLGIHQMSPSEQPIYVSPNSVVFNSINFEDISSFPVSGVVYYKGTDYPLEGANLYIDGVICSKDGQLISTNSEGKFEISVPIGDHFIKIEKSGHTFVDDGRYPSDPYGAGTKYTFNQEMSNLTFYDSTLVNVAGRVVGGNIEKEKPLGLAQSKNNIGKSTLKLSSGSYRLNVVKSTSGTTVSYEDNATDVAIASASSKVESKAYRKGGNNTEVRYIYITTDSLTGEFSAMLPPLAYNIDAIDIDNNPGQDFGNLPIIDASNPLYTLTDSIESSSGGYETFEYNSATILALNNTPTFTVTDKSNSYGAYGESEFNYADIDSEDKISLYSVDSQNGNINYLYNYPVFIKNNQYSFKLKGFEEYYNYDIDVNNPVVSEVPLEGSIVTIANEMSSSQSVYTESGTANGVEVDAGDIVDLSSNQITLDSDGEAIYEWSAGFPNIVEPYTRGLNIMFENNGQQLEWSGNSTFKAIILGSLPSGNNFVTSGPDEVLMVLRDPAGTNSYAFIEEGSTLTTESSNGAAFLSNSEATTTTNFGTGHEIVVGSLPGAATISSVRIENTLDVGFRIDAEAGSSSTTTRSVTTTSRIATSDSPDYVGANGDLFIGSATNIIFGKARNITITKDISGSYILDNVEQVSVGTEFGTGFKYTQSHIENNLIPNIYTLRDALIQSVPESTLNSYTNSTDEVVYLSTLSSDDERFGSRNSDTEVWGSSAVSADALSGPSYTIFKPQVIDADSVYTDRVLYYNEQIRIWTETLAKNEESKVKAIEKRDEYLAVNHSFDAGATIESSVTTCTSDSETKESTVDILFVAGGDIGFSVNETGVTLSLKEEIGAQTTSSDTETEEECVTTGYVLADDGYNDALTLDVYNAPDENGAIFYTRGGQTSCPYEDAAYTKYYEPGTIISTATMRVEIPEVVIEDSYATNIPSGGTASYAILLRNTSETGDDVWFDLKVVDATNPSGARISMDGSVLTESGRSVLIPANKEITKTIQLDQTQIDVLEYCNIAVVLASQCQGDPTGLFPVIADTTYLSAYYVPTCSNIILNIDETTLNMFTSSTLSLKMSGFDRSYNSFEAIRLEYKYANDASWTTGMEYVLNSEDLTSSNQILPSDDIISVAFPMDNSAIYPDGVYQFRLVAACSYGSGEVFSESETITVTKDMSSPQVLGLPNPADGILSAGDVISLTFNEDIRSGALTDANNYIVTGTLNDATIANDVALRADGTSTAAASTAASIPLEGNDFAVDMWINYTSAGTIFEHGTGSNKFIIAINQSGKLVVTIGGESFTSEDAIPSDKWCFLTLNYDLGDSNALLSALLAEDASEIELFTSEVVPTYTGYGVVALGREMIGAVHEVSLWDYARSTVEAMSGMYSSKAASTPNLIGYWRLNEGNGTVGTDIARSRHLTLAVDSWYINSSNIAAEIGANGYIDLNIATVPAGDNDSFMLEMWFRGDTQSDATLWSINDNTLAIKFNADGKLTLVTNQSEKSLSNTNYLDNSWHHVALNVLRNGTSIVYVDGVAVTQVSSSTVPALSSDILTIGANRVYTEGSTYTYNSNFEGEVDEIRYWKANLNGTYIANNRYSRVDKDDVAGLMAYYPFEVEGLDGANQVINTFTLDDMSASASGTATQLAVSESGIAPSLKSAPTATNIQYSTVASEREIVFNITETPARVEGTTINVTVRNVRDLNDNLMDPVTWSVYVNSNRLVWSSSDIAIDKLITESVEFTVKVENLGSTSENWFISNIPSWLNASKVQGTLSALSSSEITFTIEDNMPLGRYEEAIYLYGNDEIYVPYVISLNVTTEAPDWSVNPSDFEHSMNIIGQLSMVNTPSYDSSDLVAAFIGDECVGLASPEYYSRYDSYYIVMDVYGRAEDNTVSPLEFKVWDASTGYIYPVVETSRDLTFDADAVEGTFTDPFLWNASELIEFEVALDAGWNWISLPIELSDNSVTGALSSIAGSASMIKDFNNFAQYYGTQWYGSLTTIDLGVMYNIEMTEADNLLSIGSIVDADETTITLYDGWNWIGYTPIFTLPIDDALAGFNAITGDVIKGKVGFAMYQDYQWVGTLRSLEPGVGYKLNNVGDSGKEFTFPATSPYTQSLLKSTMMILTQDEYIYTFEEIPPGKYSGNMTMIAVVEKDGVRLLDVEVGVFDDEECREVQLSTSDGFLFLTTGGEGVGAELHFKVAYEGEVYVSSTPLTFIEDIHYGNIVEPFVIEISETTSIEDATVAEINIYPTTTEGIVYIDSEIELAQITLFSPQGGVVYNSTAEERSVDISPYSNGIYILMVIDVDGNKHTQKIIKR